MFSGKRLSKFDPQERGLSRLQKHLQRFFPERQLIVRSGERMRTLRLSTNRQAVMAALLAIVGGWTLLSSSLVMNHTEMIRAKNTEIKDARMGYEQLLAQVSIYKSRVSELTGELESSYVQSLAVVERESDLLKQKAAELAEQSPGKAPAKKNLVARIKEKAKEAIKDSTNALTGDSDNVELALDKAKLERTHADADRQSILNELADLESSMVEVVDHHTKTPFIATDGLEIRQVALERDLAISERDALNGKVDELEGQIREMESNQLLLYHRFTEVAESKIASIESSLSVTGLDVDLLVRQQQRRSRGQGGPFVPVNASTMNSGPLEESLNRLNGQMDRLSDLQVLLQQIPLDAPLEKFDLNSGFGVRKDPFTGQFAQHLGLDMGAKYKTNITATGDGKVIYADWEGNYGRLVVIDHGLGLVTKFGHLAKILVKKGDVVTRGTVIGQLGCSGRCTGPHVHYEVHHNGKPINPLKFLKAGSDVFKG
ncbi:MAG: peptidoglycan DD-metalloendopeptidase family protein [Rhodobacteraceae bacterium]|nr:peptidoglycan DD-metalloendopeptidase family protein [Paracoccaceae bacterium]